MALPPLWYSTYIKKLLPAVVCYNLAGNSLCVKETGGRGVIPEDMVNEISSSSRHFRTPHQPYIIAYLALSFSSSR